MSIKVAEHTGKTVADVGRVFGSGGTDGLILYALILATFLMFVVAVAVLWSASRERVRKDIISAQQVKDSAEASKLVSEALRDTATAIAASASANMTFQQAQASMLERLEIRLARERD